MKLTDKELREVDKWVNRKPFKIKEYFNPLVLIVIVTILVSLTFFFYGKSFNEKRIKRFERNHPIMEIGYENKGGHFYFTAPKGHFIMIDTVNQRIQVIDSVWVK